MRTVVLLFIGFFISISAGAQILTQDAEGKSAIIWSGGTIGVDIAETQLKANYNYFPVKPRGVIAGIDLQGKNAEGIAPLFKDGNFVPKGEGSILLGGKESFTHYNVKNGKSKLLKLNKAISDAQKEINQQLQPAETAYKALVDKTITGCGKALTTTAKDKLKGFNKPVSWVDDITKIAITDDFKDCPSLASEIIGLANEVGKQKILQDYIDAVKAHQKAVNNKNKFTNKQIKTSSMLLYYLRGGAEISEFKFDLGDSLSTIKSRFVDTLFVGAYGEFGLTYRVKNWYLGLAGGVGCANNFASLTKGEYKFTTDTTISGGKLETSKEITAYSGNYGRFLKPYLNFDLVHMASLQKSHYLGVGIYLRTNFATDTALFKGNTVFGLAVNFINGEAGKFLGGVYVQSNDVGSQGGNGVWNSVSVGITTRFSFASIFPK